MVRSRKMASINRAVRISVTKTRKNRKGDVVFFKPQKTITFFAFFRGRVMTILLYTSHSKYRHYMLLSGTKHISAKTRLRAQKQGTCVDTYGYSENYQVFASGFARQAVLNDRAFMTYSERIRIKRMPHESPFKPAACHF